MNPVQQPYSKSPLMLLLSGNFTSDFIKDRFIGNPHEHPIWGQLGHFAVIVAFVGAVMASVAYFISVQNKNELQQKSWLRFARNIFWVHAAAVVVIGASLFVIIQRHYFEYHYAFEHSSLALPPKYLLACFWEGQEGSFLLWMFWDVVLGTAIIFTVKKWESPVMAIFCVVQAFLASMLFGIYFFGYKIGSSPFILMRDFMVGAPIFQRADYMDFIKDGNGLNPLLQNYWMVIHPPTLFLGFASTLVPFSFALSALWRKDFTGWTKEVKPWALFSGMILGTGIMMGAAWAYESLTFGGYWAWDPVENASLVPWLMLLAGLHTLFAYNHSGHSLRSTFLFFILTFILILYSTFLTRSGILGNTSVHAFTDLGMSGQLLIYMAALSIPALVLLVMNWRKIPTVKKEEPLWTREFWLFIGSIILLIASVHIMATTSIPVWDKITGAHIAPPNDRIAHYNRFQIPIAIIIALLSTSVLYLRFKQSEIKVVLRKLILPFVISIIFTVAVAILYNFKEAAYIILLFSGVFSVTANLNYFIVVLSGKIKLSGAAVAHLGFGLFLVGVLISSARQQVVTYNNLNVDYGKSFDEQAKRDNMLLYKDEPSKMLGYDVTYIGDSAAPPNYYYKVLYVKKDSVTGKVINQFILRPNAQINPKMGLIASPDTRHFWNKDIYTHLTSVPDRTEEDKAVPEDSFKRHEITIGDTIFASNSYIVLTGLKPIQRSERVDIQQGDLAIVPLLDVKTMVSDTVYHPQPIFYIHNSNVSILDDKVRDLGLTIRLIKIDPETKKITLDVAMEKPLPDYIIMKAILFPQINLVWLGAVIVVLGFFISLVRTVRKKLSAKT
jgi:cytochrome c-type biogenesis protein CcmF